MIFKKQKTCKLFLLSYGNTNGSLGERVMLWEHELIGTCSYSILKIFQNFTSVSITQQKHKNMFSISFRKFHDEKRKQLGFTLIIKR